MDIEMTFVQKGSNVVPITLTCSWGGGTIDDFLKPPLPVSEKGSSIGLDPNRGDGIRNDDNPSKLAAVVFMASNCGAGGANSRTAYVQELMKHIAVDSYGLCLHNKDLPDAFKGRIYDDHGKSMKNKIALFKNYKFVLAFENNDHIYDYVTEKIVNVFQVLAIHRVSAARIFIVDVFPSP
jgi:hypothetical protein